MQKKDIKENVDDMILQMCRYIKACDLSDKEDREIKIESAATIITSAIDITDSPKDNQEYIANQIGDVLAAVTILIKHAFREIVSDNYDKDNIIWF